MRRFITFLLLLSSLVASAKLTQFIVRGFVVKQDYSKADWYRESLDSVFVALLRNDTIPVDFKMLSGNDELKMTSTDELRLLAQGGVGSYSLILNREGYEPLRNDFKIVSEGQDVVYLRNLAMEPRREGALSELEVVGTAIKMVMKGDTIVYDSRAFKLAEGSTLDALVRQLPGAQLDEDGAITVNGRKVNSLMLDGNDFFQGDPEVALKNLPAYTVDKIKVYDQTAKDDNVTLASQTLSRTVNDENLVMDVTLKKEFSMGAIVNVEAGYGPGIYNRGSSPRTDSRYIGRAFAIGFGRNYRWGAYGGYNNLRNGSRANSYNKEWGYDWGDHSGDGTTAVGGLDVFFNPTKKWEFQASADYKREDIDARTLSSSTKFFDTGNQYQRSSQQQNTLEQYVSASGSLRYKGDRVSAYFSPRFNWGETNRQSVIRWANFSENPAEQYMGQALDSLFANKLNPFLRRSVTSSTYRATNAKPDRRWLTLGLWLNASWRPAKGRGLFQLSASGSSTKSNAASGQLFAQPYMADPSAERINQQQWDRSNKRDDSWGANVEYQWDKKRFGQKYISTFKVDAAVGYDLARNYKDNVLMAQLLLDGLDFGSNPLPSVTAPENIRPLLNFDVANSLKSLDLNNEAMGRAYFSYGIEPAAPSDSAFNPSISINATYTHRQYWRHFYYAKPFGDFSFTYNSCEPVERVNGGIYIGCQNKVHSLSGNIGYSLYTELRSIASLVPTMTNADPTNVFIGPEGGLQSFPQPVTHNLWAYLRYNNLKNHHGGYLSAYYYNYRDRLAQSSSFDPATGITTHRPMTVNGNWEASVRASYEVSFGEHDCWNAYLSPSYQHYNSVDYVSTIGPAERSVVKSDFSSIGGMISYKLKNGTRFGLGAGTTYRYSASPRADFQPISVWDSNLRAAISFYLPAQIEGETEMRALFPRGYSDATLNTSQWIWNASVQKSILKGSLTFKLQAVDILGQLSNVSYDVNAQGRTETWTNALPRYVLLTIGYRFNFTPNALK